MCLFTHHSCYSTCIRVLPLYPFDLSFFFSQPRKVTICGRHEMASVRDIKIAEALLMLIMLWNESAIAEIETLWLSCIEIWGACFTSIFSVMAGWIVEMLFMLLFALHKGAFCDALCLHYGWLPRGLPSKCVCGSRFTVDQAMNCSSGGSAIIRHNELRDFTATACISENMSWCSHWTCTAKTIRGEFTLCHSECGRWGSFGC